MGPRPGRGGAGDHAQHRHLRGRPAGVGGTGLRAPAGAVPGLLRLPLHSARPLGFACLAVVAGVPGLEQPAGRRPSALALGAAAAHARPGVCADRRIGRPLGASPARRSTRCCRTGCRSTCSSRSSCWGRSWGWWPRFRPGLASSRRSCWWGSRRRCPRRRSWSGWWDIVSSTSCCRSCSRPASGSARGPAMVPREAMIARVPPDRGLGSAPVPRIASPTGPRHAVRGVPPPLIDALRIAQHVPAPAQFQSFSRREGP